MLSSECCETVLFDCSLVECGVSLLQMCLQRFVAIMPSACRCCTAFHSVASSRSDSSGCVLQSLMRYWCLCVVYFALLVLYVVNIMYCVTFCFPSVISYMVQLEGVPKVICIPWFSCLQQLQMKSTASAEVLLWCQIDLDELQNKQRPKHFSTKTSVQNPPFLAFYSNPKILGWENHFE